MPPKQPATYITYLLLLLTSLLWLLSKRTLGSIAAVPLISLGQIAALLGTILFAFSFILAVRTYLIEEACGGLDCAYRLHHKTGAWAAGLLAAHGVAVTIGYSMSGAPIFTLLTSNIIFIAGALGLIAMGGIVIAIIFFKIPYKYFTLVQKFFAIPFAFGAYHLLFITSDISRYAPLRILIMIVVGLGAIAWIYREIFYRWLAPQAIYIVKEVKNKGTGIVEITLLSKTGRINFAPGQFAYFSFNSKNISAEVHPFSFSSAPNDNALRFAAKAVGDFTNELIKIIPGDTVRVFGPYGKFFSELNLNAENIFIAGGIGITPFLSALRTQSVNNKTTFFCSTKNEDECVFSSELNELAAAPNAFKLHLHESDRRGHLTADIIEKRANGIKDKKIYICGPALMMNALKKQFIGKGAPSENIIFEMFNY
jgi:predicted ferric reductase